MGVTESRFAPDPTLPHSRTTGREASGCQPGLGCCIKPPIRRRRSRPVVGAAATTGSHGSSSACESWRSHSGFVDVGVRYPEVEDDQVRRPRAHCPVEGGAGDFSSCVWLVELSKAASGSHQLEPYVARTVVDPPAARERVYEAESPAPDAVEATLRNDAFEPLPVIDHLDDQMVLVETRVQLDGASAVHERVCHQFADQQRGVTHLTLV